MANKLMNRVFTKREKVLLLVVIVLVIAGLYYLLVIKNLGEAQAVQTEQLDTLKTQVAAQKTLASNYAKMEKVLSEMDSTDKLSIVASYDNVGNEINELNSVLAQTSAYNISWEQPALDGQTVRRKVKISFTSGSYDAAISVIDALQNGKYRCQVGDITLAGKMLADGTIESVAVSLSATFYETTNGATTTNGLTNSGKTSGTSSAS